MENEENKVTHGGRREGAGRKSEDRSPVTIRLRNDLKKKIAKKKINDKKTFISKLEYMIEYFFDNYKN